MHDKHGFLLIDALFALLITTIIIMLLYTTMQVCRQAIAHTQKGADIDVEAIVEVTNGLYPD